MLKIMAVALPLVMATTTAFAAPAPTDDRAEIQTLLDTYQTAVSKKDQATFETLLLSKDIPFAYVPGTPTSTDAVRWRDYEGFRRGVFEGPAFTQKFQDVSIRQHGALADVDLVYINHDTSGDHPGWKTMQLIKVGRSWKIASEFFTGLNARDR